MKYGHGARDLLYEPYLETRVEQQLTLIVAQKATLLLADTFLAGRIARGERHHYLELALRTVAARPKGTTLFRDTVLLEPGRRPVTALDLLGDAAAFGSFYLLGPSVAAQLETILAEKLGLLTDRASVTRLPRDCGLLVRALAASASELRAVLATVLAVSRAVLRRRETDDAIKL